MTAREWAAHYVADLLRRGYTVEAAREESTWGCSAPGEPGWEIRKGIIQVPWNGGEKFKFAELAKEVPAAPVEIQMQMELAL